MRKCKLFPGAVGRQDHAALVDNREARAKRIERVAGEALRFADLAFHLHLLGDVDGDAAKQRSAMGVGHGELDDHPVALAIRVRKRLDQAAWDSRFDYLPINAAKAIDDLSGPEERVVLAYALLARLLEHLSMATVQINVMPLLILDE